MPLELMGVGALDVLVVVFFVPPNGFLPISYKHLNRYR